MEKGTKWGFTGAKTGWGCSHMWCFFYRSSPRTSTWQDLQKAISESQAKQRIDHKSHECCKKIWGKLTLIAISGVISLRMTEAHSLGILDGTAWQNGTTLEGYRAGVSGITPHTFTIIRHLVIGPQNFSECHSNHSIFSPTHLEISFGKAHRKWTEKLWNNKHINTKGTTSIGHHILELLQATLKELNSHISKVRPEVAKMGITWANGIPVGAPKLCSLHRFEGREWDTCCTPKIQYQKYSKINPVHWQSVKKKWLLPPHPSSFLGGGWISWVSRWMLLRPSTKKKQLRRTMLRFW